MLYNDLRLGRLTRLHVLQQITRFAIHVLVGTILFAVVGSAAVALHWFTAWLHTAGVSPYILTALEAGELFVFSVDFLCFVTFVIKEAYILLRGIVRAE